MINLNVFGNGSVLCLSQHSSEYLDPTFNPDLYALYPDEGRIIARNTGAQNTTNNVVTVVIPAGLTYFSHSATQGVYNSGTGEWAVGTLTPGQDEFLEICFTVTDDTLKPYEITYTLVHDDQPDQIPPDDAASRTIDGLTCSQFGDCVILTCGPEKKPIITVTEDYVIDLDTDGIILIDASAVGVDVTVTLPAAADAFDATCGNIYTITLLDDNAGGNTVTLSADVGEVIVHMTIPASAVQTFVFSSVGESITVVSNGTFWKTI